jgi:hypothetical protein
MRSSRGPFSKTTNSSEVHSYKLFSPKTATDHGVTIDLNPLQNRSGVGPWQNHGMRLKKTNIASQFSIVERLNMTIGGCALRHRATLHLKISKQLPERQATRRRQ